MRNLSWLTDPHLNFLRPPVMEAFSDHLADSCSDALIISGDIAEAPSILPLMDILDRKLGCPIYFVLGNHDYYRGSITDTRDRVRTWSRQSRRTRWLPDIGVTSLTEETALIGHGSWSDGRVGDFMGSSVWINDYRYIHELTCNTRNEVHRRIMELGDEAADYLETILEEALQTHRHVLLVTHSPPFAEACWHEGKAVVNDWTPHFTCQAVGQRLVEVMDAHPDQSLQVVCGHTHGEGEVQIRPNIHVRTGGAEYNAPQLQEPIGCP
jgi:predicted MPP superfamily phosphohydrolase